jgi:hypothetical protein
MSPNDPLPAYFTALLSLLHSRIHYCDFQLSAFDMCSSSQWLVSLAYQRLFAIVPPCQQTPRHHQNVTVVTRGSSTVAPPASLSVASVPACLFELIMYPINYPPLHHSVLPTLPLITNGKFIAMHIGTATTVVNL